MNLKEPYLEQRLPKCKPVCPEPDIRLCYYEPPTHQYRLYCENCKQRGPALSHRKLLDAEMENAVVLEPINN